MAYPDSVDFSTFFDDTGVGDLDGNFTPISWTRSRVELVARRWTTIPGEMDDPEFGYPIQRYFNAGMLPVELQALQAGLKREALKVEGIEDASVRVQRNPGTGEVSIAGEVVLAEGTAWRFVFALSGDKLALITLLGPGD